MPRDPLAVLLRLRGLEVLQAQRRLADRLSALSQAEMRAQAACDALREEGAGDAAELAAWLPRGLAERDRAAALRAQRAASADQARQAVAEARIAQRATETLRAQRREEQRRSEERRNQALLDAAGLRRCR